MKRQAGHSSLQNQAFYTDAHDFRDTILKELRPENRVCIHFAMNSFDVCIRMSWMTCLIDLKKIKYIKTQNVHNSTPLLLKRIHM